MKKKGLFFRSAAIIVLIIFSTTHTTPIPADISCCIADIKFDGERVQMCELGTCTWSYFRGHEALYGDGLIWQAIWNHLAQFNLPLWYIGKGPQNEAKKEEMSYQTFVQHNGTIIPSLKDLAKILRTTQRNANHNPHDISTYDGIVILRNFMHRETKQTIDQFRTACPTILIMDTAAAPIVNNKAATNRLCIDPASKAIKPDWRVYKKTYHPELAQNLIKEFNYPTYVIKPTNMAEGRGVLIVQQRHLQETLKKIFTEQNNIKHLNDSSYNYWAKDLQKEFVIEEYVPSKPIEVNHKRYDATMRVIFALTYHNQQANITYLGSYWKLPTHDLDNIRGDLNDKHKSKIGHSKKSSAMVTDEDEALVQELMRPGLMALYTRMLSETAKA